MSTNIGITHAYRNPHGEESCCVRERKCTINPDGKPVSGHSSRCDNGQQLWVRRNVPYGATSQGYMIYTDPREAQTHYSYL